MAASKNTLNKVLAAGVATLLLLLGQAFGADELDWTNFTSFKSVRQMRLIGDTVYVVSSGGILAVSDVGEQGAQYTNLDGLGTNDLTDIICDASGQKWVTGFGRLIRFDGANSRQYLFFDMDDNLFELHRVVDDGDYLWVGTDMGLVLFSKSIDGGQIQDSYQLFDDLNPEPDVYDILLKGDSIILATSSGLAIAERGDPSQLKSPLNWSGYSIAGYPQLGTDTVINVAEHNSEIYLATRRGFHRLQIDIDTSYIVPITVENLTELYQMKEENDSLFVYYSDGAAGRIGVLEGTSLAPLDITGLSSEPRMGVGDGSTRWVAVEDGVFYSASGGYTEYPYTGMPGNDITDIAINSDGVLTAGFRYVTMARFEDSKWIEYDFDVVARTTRIMSDSSGRTWMGTSGNGVFVWDGDTVVHYDEKNSTLHGITGYFVVILGLVTDGRYVYGASYRASNNYPIGIGDLENLDDPSGWDSIGVANGLADVYVVDLDLFGSELTVATETNGIYVCDVGDDPFNTDIICQRLTRENSLLISNNTRVVAYSPDGDLYVGTNTGLSRYDSGIDRFVDVNLPPEVSSSITCLAFDGRGNLWIGTNDGLTTVNAATGETAVYNMLNSDIVSNQINSVTFDQFTGDIYIGTTEGYSYISSRIGQPTFEVSQVVAFPNPFVVDDDNDRLSFNFAESGDVRIFTIAGELVRETTVGEPWDGRNAEGKEVASGAYVFVITDSDGNVEKGKFLLVRQ